MSEDNHKQALEHRPATASDKPWLWMLYCNLLKPSITEQWGWDEQFQKENFHSHLPTSLFTIVEHKGKPVAAYAVRDTDKHFYLHMLLVVADYQTLGIGTRVLNKLKKLAINTDKPIELSTYPANRVDGYYLKHGFKQIKTTPDKQFYQWQPEGHAADQ